MERIRTTILFLVIGLIPFGILSGQDRKNEQKIKVIVADKSGTKVVIDTSYVNTDIPDSIIVNDGKVIYITARDEDFKGDKNKQYEIVARLENDGAKAGKKYVYINKKGSKDSKVDDTFDISISDDDFESAFDNDTDKTRYVIANHGITVSIEGKDEAAVKELADRIRKDLEIMKKDKEE